MLLTDEHRELRSALRRWAEAEVAPHAAEADAHSAFPEASWKSYVENGWVRLLFPEEYGGDGADGVSCAILIEEMSRVDASSGLFALVGKLGAIPLINWGSDALKAKYLPAVATGESSMCYGLSEPDAGSDVASMKTRAVKDGNDYLLTGVKCWISNAGFADLCTVFAKTDPEAGHKGISAFVVERDWLQIGKLEDKLGVRGNPTGELVLDGVRVPAENMIGEEGQGFYLAMGTLDRSRPAIGAQAVGIAQGAIDLAGRYMQERKQFGKPIADFQGLQFMLADMAMKTEAARLLVYKAAALTDGDPHQELTITGAMAKCFAADVAMAVTTDGVQLLGGVGYTKDFPMERYFRDAKITQIYEGTNQVQRIVIARQLLK